MAAIDLTDAASVSAVVLAAGSGVRLRTPRPSLLEDLCGQPVVLPVLNAVVGAGVSNLAVVIARGAEDVVKTLQGRLGDVGLGFAEQAVQRGTGDAVLAGLSALEDTAYGNSAFGNSAYGNSAYEDNPYNDNAHVLVVHGDLPLLTSDVLTGLLEHHLRSGAEATVLTAPAVGPFAHRSRVHHKPAGTVSSIALAHEESGLESEDSSEGNHAVAGCYVVRRGLLAAAIRRTSPQNSRGEYNLDDAIEVLASAGHVVESCAVEHPDSVRSVGNYEDLAIAEALLRNRLTTSWMARGVRMIDPQRTYIDTDVVLGAGVVLQPGTILRGFTVVGDYAELGPDTHLTDCAIGQYAKVIRTTGRDAEVGPRAVVGPFASLEPGAQVAPDTVSGPNFVAQYAD